MSDNLLLDGAVMAVSLFNMILLLWLGLTVLLNVERRVLGAWLLGGGLLVGAAFFASHTAILGYVQVAGMAAESLPILGQNVNLWWRIGWVPVIVSPFGWYGLILWYAGFWQDAANIVYRRHRLWLPVMSIVMLVLLGLVLFTDALPTLLQVPQQIATPASALSGPGPALLAVYALFMVHSILLSLDALRHPAPSPRFMGDLARARTRPWLMAAALTLLAVSLLVAGFMVWAMRNVALPATPYLAVEIILTTIRFDLLIESLIAITVVLIGQAIVAYELFTGRSLPRRGFWRHWRSALFLAAGYSLAVGVSLALGLHTIYSLLLTTILMIVFFALFSWRSFVHRERYMAQLRPFVVHRAGGDSAAFGRPGPTSYPSLAHSMFQAVCVDILHVERAQLSAIGALAPLAGPPLVYAASTSDIAPPEQVTPPPVAALANGGLLASLSSQEYAGFQWAIPLWAARGLIGAILLESPRDGRLFTQEEIEHAQASGERIVDMLASEELMRRLVVLQRRRLAETQVLDHQTRRILHDRILPELHAVLLQTSEAVLSPAASQGTIASLTQIHREVAELIRVSPGVQLPSRRSDMLLADLTRMIALEFGHEFQHIDWQKPSQKPDLDPLVAEVTFFAVREVVRNAAIHSRGDDPQRPVRLTIRIRHGNEQQNHDCTALDSLVLIIEDDGVGLALESKGSPPVWDPAVEESGLSLRGGLALHSTMLAIIGGTLTLSPRPGGGAQVCITVPRRG